MVYVNSKWVEFDHKLFLVLIHFPVTSEVYTPRWLFRNLLVKFLVFSLLLDLVLSLYPVEIYFKLHRHRKLVFMIIFLGFEGNTKLFEMVIPVFCYGYDNRHVHF